MGYISDDTRKVTTHRLYLQHSYVQAGTGTDIFY